MRTQVTASLTAENTFTPWTGLLGNFLLEITGIAGGTEVVFQRTRDAGVSVIDIETFTADAFYTSAMPSSGCLYRAGIKTGKYGSGTVVLYLEA